MENKYVDMIVKQWKILVAAGVAIVLILAVVGIWKGMQDRRNLAATDALYEAQTNARKAVGEKKFEEAERAYQGLFDKFNGSRAAFEGRLQLGDIWMDSGNYDKAIQHYQAALESASDAFSRLLSHYTLGVAKESAGKLQEAVAEYEQALQAQGSDFLRPEILMAQARCYEALQQPAKAIELYKTVQEKFATRSYYSGAASAFEKQLSTKPL
jgi:tetratricopeptide (TPR) repeat protein